MMKTTSRSARGAGLNSFQRKPYAVPKKAHIARPFLSWRRVRFTPVAAAIFAIFAVTRLAGTGWGPAAVQFSGAAAQPPQLVNAGPDGAITTDEGRPRTSDVDAPTDVPLSTDIRTEMFDQLSARKKDLDVRERSLDTREQLIVAAEQKLAADLSVLRREIATLEQLNTAQAAAAQEDLSGLSRAYERMRPRDAARIFNELDEEILVPVAAGMRTQALAATLAKMTPANAEALTKALAAYNSRFQTANDDREDEAE